MLVSVPLRGLHFSNLTMVFLHKLSLLCFRPLAGTAFLKSKNKKGIEQGLTFPSPHGDCISQMIRQRKYRKFLKIVSVPSRGLHFSNIEMYRLDYDDDAFPSPHGDCISQIRKEGKYENYCKRVSVPSRGLHFSNGTLKLCHTFP